MKATLDTNLVVGSKIEEVSSARAAPVSETNFDTFRFYLRLSTGITIDMRLDSILLCDRVDPYQGAPRYLVLDGPKTLVGESVVAIVKRILEVPEALAKSEGKYLPQYTSNMQVALALSSGRIATVFHHCDGSNAFLVESFERILKYSRNWQNFSTGEPISLDPLTAS